MIQKGHPTLEPSGNQGREAEPDIMPEAQEQEDDEELPLMDYENDPYLASALEFMYSEDTEEDFGTMGRQQQEALLKKTWLEREKQFYGEEIDDE